MVVLAKLHDLARGTLSKVLQVAAEFDKEEEEKAPCTSALAGALFRGVQARHVLIGHVFGQGMPRQGE